MQHVPVRLALCLGLAARQLAATVFEQQLEHIGKSRKGAALTLLRDLPKGGDPGETSRRVSGVYNKPKMKPLEGKVAIITGAARLRGIGRAAAIALAADGADIVVTGTGRDPSTFPDDEKAVSWRGIDSTAAQVREQGQRCVALQADATSSADAERVVSAAITEFGHVDILVNNAAVGRGADRVPLTELSEEIWRSVLDVKLTGSFLMCRAVVPGMMARGQGGSIVKC